MKKRILLSMLAMILAFAQVWAAPVDSLRINPRTTSLPYHWNGVELTEGNSDLFVTGIKPVNDLNVVDGHTLNAAPAAIASIIAQYAPNIHFCEYDESVTFNNVMVGSSVTKTYEVWSHNVYTIAEALRSAINRTLGINVSIKVKLCLSQSSTLTNIDGIFTSRMFSVSPSLMRPADIDLGEGGSRQNVRVTFKPTEAGTYKFRFVAMFDFWEGDRHLPDWLTIIPIINVAGIEYWYGTAVNPSYPQIIVSPTALSFGTVTKGNTAQKTFTVKGSNLTSSVTLSSSNPNFTVSPTTISAADAAAGKTVTVTYKPTAVGSHSGTITISGGGATNKTVSVTGTCVNPPTITVNGSSLDFGTVVKDNYATKTFTVTATNLTGNLTVTSSNSYFTVSPTTLPANGGSVIVTYKPTAVGSHSATITISCGATSKSFTVTGTCIYPKITTSVSSLAFGNVVKDKQKSLTFMVTGTDLTGSLTLSSNNSNFTVSPTTITASEAAAGKTITITYKPTTAGSHSGTITISGGGAASKMVSVSGKGVVPSISTGNTTALAFGTVVKGNTASKTFTVTGANLTGSLTLSSSNSNFTVSPTTITAANAANGVIVTVTYKPTATGSHSGTITIRGGGATDKVVSVSGKCVVPAISVSPTSISFGTVVKDKQVDKSFWVTGSNLTGSLTVSSSNSNFIVSPTSISAAEAAEGKMVTVTYKPTAAGSHSATITVKGGGASPKTVSVTGTCVVPTITVSATSLLFAGYNDSRTLTVKGTNLTGSLTLSTNNSYFSVSPTTITVAEAKAGKTVLVHCNAGLNTQRATGILTISGGGAAPKKVSLSYVADGPVPYAPLVLPDEEETDGEPLDIIISEEHEASAIALGNSSTGVEEMAIGELSRDVKIYAEGQDIVIETPVEQSAIVSDIAGHARRVNLQAGRNVIPAGGNGVHIVRVGEKSAKLMLR